MPRASRWPERWWRSRLWRARHDGQHGRVHARRPGEHDPDPRVAATARIWRRRYCSSSWFRRARARRWRCNRRGQRHDRSGPGDGRGRTECAGRRLVSPGAWRATARHDHGALATRRGAGRATLRDRRPRAVAVHRLGEAPRSGAWKSHALAIWCSTSGRRCSWHAVPVARSPEGTRPAAATCMRLHSCGRAASTHSG